MHHRRTLAASFVTPRRTPLLLVFAACVTGALGGCLRRHDDGAAPQAEVVSATSAPAPPPSSVPPAVASAAPPPPPSVKELVPVPFAPAEGIRVLSRIEGALVVAKDEKVGRIIDGRIEWLQREIPHRDREGGLEITDVYGRWPDAVDVVYVQRNPRFPMPTYAPLTGKGDVWSEATGGGHGEIVGAARVGESLVVSSYAYLGGHRLVTVKGPRLARFVTDHSVCNSPDVGRWGSPDALLVWAFEGTPAGTLLALGSYCRKDAAVEVWDRSSVKSKILLLDTKGGSSGGTSLVPGSGDEAFLLVGGILFRYEAGKVERLVGPGPTVHSIFALEGGALHANAGRALYRYERGAWTLVGRFWFPRMHVTEWDGAYWTTYDGMIQRLESGEVTFREGCKTPFVHLSDVSENAPPRYSFPATQKVLAAFPGVKDLSLVEFTANRRRLGAVVKDGAQGEALVAHVRANVKEDDPVLLCYSPKSRREIPITAKP